MDLKFLPLPTELCEKIPLYLSHPTADLIKKVPYKFMSSGFDSAHTHASFTPVVYNTMALIYSTVPATYWTEAAVINNAAHASWPHCCAVWSGVYP